MSNPDNVREERPTLLNSTFNHVNKEIEKKEEKPSILSSTFTKQQDNALNDKTVEQKVEPKIEKPYLRHKK